jgi:chromate transporter
MTPLALTLTPADWLSLFLHFATLSLLTVGGAIATAPDMHRFLVDEKGWLTDPQFNASIAIAQAAPGPNVLFTALMGWNVGVNAGSFWSGLLGMALCLSGIMIPSSVLVYMTTQWSHRNRDRRAVRAFKQGMAPLVIGLLVSTGWILATAHGKSLANWPLWLLTFVSTLVVWRTRVHLLWLLGAGAILGWMGWV